MILAVSASAKRLSVALGGEGLTVRDAANTSHNSGAVNTSDNGHAANASHTGHAKSAALWAFESMGVHSRDLPYAIQNMPISLQDVRGIVVDIGPGSFMSVRLAVSFAEGLALARHLPILPVDSLAAVFYGALLDDADGAKNDIEGDTITVQLPARGNAYYTSVWQREDATAKKGDSDRNGDAVYTVSQSGLHPAAWQRVAPPFLSDKRIEGAMTAMPSAVSLLRAAAIAAVWQYPPFGLTPCYVEQAVAAPAQ